MQRRQQHDDMHVSLLAALLVPTVRGAAVFEAYNYSAHSLRGYDTLAEYPVWNEVHSALESNPDLAQISCSDNSPWWFNVRLGNPRKVLVFIHGGAGCTDEFTCAAGNYVKRLDDFHKREGAELCGQGGIYDACEAKNLFANWTIVDLPYCTADSTFGNAIAEWPDLTVRFRGATNTRLALSYLFNGLVDNDAVTHAVLSGSSAGAVGTRGWGLHLRRAFPEARLTVVADAQGYLDSPMGAAVHGVDNDILRPQWSKDLPTLPGPPSTITIGDMDRYYSNRDKTQMVNMNSAFDSTFVFFSAWTQIDKMKYAARSVHDRIVKAQNTLEDEPNFYTYIFPGSLHTTLLFDAVYETPGTGPPIMTWLSEIVTGNSQPADIRCDRDPTDPCGVKPPKCEETWTAAACSCGTNGPSCVEDFTNACIAGTYTNEACMSASQGDFTLSGREIWTQCGHQAPCDWYDAYCIDDPFGLLTAFGGCEGVLAAAEAYGGCEFDLSMAPDSAAPAGSYVKMYCPKLCANFDVCDSEVPTTAPTTTPSVAPSAAPSASPSAAPSNADLSGGTLPSPHLGLLATALVLALCASLFSP